MDSTKAIPTLFTLHAGGWVTGSARDDDEWNRHMADTYNILIISLEYSQAPWYPFPHAINDVEALYLACMADESLPIARASRTGTGFSQIALLGWASGANLAFAVAQLPSLKEDRDVAPRAAVSISGIMDLARKPLEKLRNRFYKPALGLPRGGFDPLARLSHLYDWAYIPYGHDLFDPFLSPAFARFNELPPHLYFIGAELDMFSHENWRMAVRLANEGNLVRGLQQSAREMPDIQSRWDKMKFPGKRAASKKKGELVEADVDLEGRFAWNENWGDTGSVNWLLVPDVVHGFDNIHIRRTMGGGEDTFKDAEMKTAAYQEILGNWLNKVVFKVA